MNTAKRKKLESAGWKVGSAAEFLGLTLEEELLVEMKLAFAERIKERRQKLDITQQQFAKKLGSSQSRVAKIEKADRSVSMELLVRSLVTLGASREEIGNVIIGRPTRRRKAGRGQRSSRAATPKRAAKM
jgi:DNA-binding XRE family transcriptional regulator